MGDIGKVVIGRENEVELLLLCFLARGHALLEGVPGVSKTLLARAFARALNLTFGRVQFTPDMVPLDIIGGFIFNLKSREFEFRRGPIFTCILLADEINRAPPKVQSALLEAMQELQVTVEGHTESLPSPFMVVATQNPIEFQGVFPLPEGQLDRFMVKVNFGYISRDDEAEMLRRNLGQGGLQEVERIIDEGEAKDLFTRVDSVKVSSDLLKYVASIAEATRHDIRIRLGASSRAALHLVQCARAHAFLDGRDYVTPDDVKSMIGPVLDHRVILSPAVVIKDSSLTVGSVVKEIVDKVIPPR
jgi:MoxR-like ATPase